VHNLNCRLGTAKIQGFQTDGFFAEYAAVDYRNAIILPGNLPIETSAPYFCAGITGE
jgi:alcohol dehydrogenase, propanol-preferring